ncbi:unnamed protein product [Laminaria digitata]
MVGFTGSSSSQEINGTFAAVPCEAAFSAESAAFLGLGSTCQFVSTTTMMVTLGVLPAIRATSSSSCSDGDGSSLSLLAGVVRIEIGAFVATSAGCVAVGYPADPDPPFVGISAPAAVGHCDDLTVEGSATLAFIDDASITWEVAIVAGDQVSTSNVTNVMDQASSLQNLTVIIPSDTLNQGSTYSFVLRVVTVMGGSAEAGATVFKSPDELLSMKVVGPSALERTRGTSITIRSETGVSSCSTMDSGENTASYSWSLVSTTATEALGEETLDESRDPRVLVIPRHTLGFAGSSYVFQLAAEFGAVSNVANVTVEITSGAIVAAISGGTRRKIGSSQAIYLNASTSVDDDGIDSLPMVYTWNCADESGSACVSPSRDTLDMSSLAAGALMSIPGGTLPIGVEYVFTVTVSKGDEDGAEEWSQLRSDNGSCIVSTSALAVPQVSINPKEIARKYNPSSRIVLYGCAAASADERCSSSSTSATAAFEFEWAQVDGNIDLESGWSAAFSTGITDPTLVARAGIFTPGRTYTFSLTATDKDGAAGYAGNSLSRQTYPP